MSTYKYQEQFASDLTAKWLAGERNEVRNIIRNLKNKAQAAYITAKIAVHLSEGERYEADCFAAFIHPNQQ